MIIERERVRCHVVGDALLGEGPIWVPSEGSLYWVDIKGQRLFCWTAATGETESWVPPFQIASLAPVAGGGFIAGTVNGFAFVDPRAGHYDVIVRPPSEPTGNRFNDGKLDRRGRFWAGTMDDAERQATGSLYRFVPGAEPLLIDSGYRVTNCPAFNLAGTRMYHTDSGRQTIFRFDLDEQGDVTGKQVFAQFEGGHGYPDGMTVDAEDCLWVAFWDGWCLRRFAPTGNQIAEVAMPVARPTSCTFGGADLATLFVTSARVNLSEVKLSRQPLAGSIFALEPGVRGVADTPFDRKHLPS
jgi:sugar lactone lactonase YvrE